MSGSSAVPLKRRHLEEREFRSHDKFSSTVDSFLDRLCVAVGRENRRFLGSRDPEAKRPLEQSYWRRYWGRVPWLTPIVGSGPLGLPPSFTADPERLADAVVEHAAMASAFTESSGIGQDEREWLHSFVRKLVEERRPEATRHDDRPTGIGRQAFSFLALAAATTRYFHRLSLDVARPISRWGSVTAKGDADSARFQESQEEHVVLIGRLVDDCLAVVDGDGIGFLRHDGEAAADYAIETRVAVDQLRGLLKTVKVNAQAGEVRLLHVQQLTDIAWFLLVQAEGQSAYPGWTDLLLRLVLFTDSAVENAYRRPRLAEADALGRHIREMHRGAALASWQAESGGSSQRFYDELAQSLIALRDVRKAEPSGAGAPYPTAFVVSFDQELEMALMRRSRPGDTICILVPIYLVPDNSDDGYFAWLEGRLSRPSILPEIQTADELAALLQPTDWRIASDDGAGDPKDMVAVVRLAGAPSIVLPTVHAADRATGARIVDPLHEYQHLVKGLEDLLKARMSPVSLAGCSLVHAITLDEYQAFRLTINEWDAHAPGAGGGLPRRFVKDDSTGPSRFWALMGVPFQDPAVRLRVLSAFTAAGSDSTVELMTSAVEPLEPPESFGSGASEERYVQPVPVAKSPSLSWGGRTLLKPSLAAVAPATGGAPKVDDQVATEVDDQVEAAVEPSSGADRPTRGFASLSGLAVSRHLDDDEVDVLVDLGFTVVHDACESFADDLHGYAEWIRKANSGYPASTGSEKTGTIDG